MPLSLSYALQRGSTKAQVQYIHRPLSVARATSNPFIFICKKLLLLLLLLLLWWLLFPSPQETYPPIHTFLQAFMYRPASAK